MSLVTEVGILLRSHDYSETSRILRFITPGHGLVSVIAKGLRKRNSRGEGGVETFDEATLVFSYRPDRDLHTLRELNVSRSRRGMGRDLLRFLGASLLAELLLTHTLQEESRGLYALVVQALDRLDEAPGERLTGLILAAGWGLVAEAGFPPVLDVCVRCGADLPATGLLRFSAASGGLLCARCGADGEGARLGPGARADLRALVVGDPPSSLRGAPAHLALLEGHAVHHLSPRRAFRSMELLRPVLVEQDAGEGEGKTHQNPSDPGRSGSRSTAC